MSSAWFAGIVTGLVTGALVTFAVTATGHSTGTRILQMVHLAGAPSCTDPGWLLQVPNDQILANSWYAAKDTLKDYSTLHTPDLTVDGNPRSAWLQWWPTDGLNNSPSSGNYIIWRFAESYDVRLVCILNGWDEDSTTFNSIQPVKYVTIGDKAPACSGTSATLSTSTYSYFWNNVKLPHNHPTSELCLQIKGTYPVNADQLNFAPGPTRHELPKRAMTGISEIRFYYSPSVLDWTPY